MKKIIITLGFILLVGVIYYFTLGSSQLVDAMKKELNHELIRLSDNGFTIDKRITEKRAEHFVITLDQPAKIHSFLGQRNIASSLESIQLLQDQKIGVDIEYLPRSQDALSMDIYPLNLPHIMYEKSEPTDKKALEILEKMLNDKVFLVHLNLNKLGNAFDGYVKDIDQNFVLDDNETHIETQGWTFEGKLNHQTVTHASQILKQFTYRVKDRLRLELNNLESRMEGLQENNRTVTYAIDTIQLNSESNEPLLLKIQDLKGTSQSQITNELLNEKSEFSINTITFNNGKEVQKMDRVHLDTSINNLNLKAMNQFQDLANVKEESSQTFDKLIPLLQQLTNADTSIDIHRMAVTTITENNETYNGFDFNGHIKIDKNFNWNQVENDPLRLVSLIDLKANLILSDRIADMLAQNPRAMLFMMLIQPKEHNGNKVYDLEYMKGSLKVNGTPLF